LDQIIEKAHYHSLTNPEEAESKTGEIVEEKDEAEVKEPE